MSMWLVGSHTLLLMWIELGHGERREVYGLHCQVFRRCGMVFAKNDCLSWTRERPQMTSPGGRFASSEGPPWKLLSIPLLDMSFVFCIYNV